MVDPTSAGPVCTDPGGPLASDLPGSWSAAQVVGQPGSHGIPVEFSGSFGDQTFDQAKGGGNANHNQTPTTCTQAFDGGSVTVQVVIKQ